ncbi:MAG: hypothetical protein O8C67_06415 [Candidatus Methanoperedens sp.]|nr:hypothetical protein [Candidatus Methanoperedens sp.]
MKNAKIEVLKEINEEKIIIRRKILFPTKKVQTMTGSIVQVEMKGDKHTLQGKLESAD